MRFHPPSHKEGDIRYVRRFAFKPRKIAEIIIWLESYYVRQEWRRSFVNLEYGWSDRRELLSDDPELLAIKVSKSPLMKALK